MLNKISQLSEATEKTKTGVKHTAEPGGYGRKDDEDDEGKKVKADAPKKGRGRPKKDAGADGETKTYDTKSLGSVFGGGKAPKSAKKGTVVKGKAQSHAANKADDGTDPGEEPKSKKKGLKEYFDSLDKALLEAEQIQIKPASQMPKTPGQTAGQTSQQVAGQPPKNTQVIAQGNKTLGTVDNPQLAQQIKQSIGKGEMTLMPGEEMAESDEDYSAKKARAGKDIGKPGKNFAKIAKSSGGGEKGKRIAGAVLAKLRAKTNEADIPPHDSLASPLSMEESKKAKPDFLDMDKDGNKKESMKKAAQDKKKEKIDEGMMDKLKGLMVPKLMKLLGPDAEKIASAVKQATGGDLTPSKENAIKVVKALGIDKAADKPEMAEGIAGNWQGKLIQALYTLGLLGAGGAAASMWGTVGGSLFATVGVLLLMFANSFFGEAPGQTGAMGKFGNKGTSAQHGLDDHGMPIRNTNVSESSKKKKVKEGMDQRLQAARLEGKAHGLKGHAYTGKNYDDMEESRMYHEGYKEGLDECYGQMPIAGGSVVDEMGMPPATVPGMANQADFEMDEGNAFTAALKKTPSGGKFSVGGKTFTDRSSIEESPFAFESLDKQLNALLESKEDVAEGMTVSISKGQQGMPDSVSVNAQDGEADQLLALIKSAGLGLFGGEEVNGYGAPQGSTQAPGGIEVVDDHDGMMALMKKLTGGEPGNGDYADEEGHEEGHEEHEHTNEEACNECGMAYESCGCDHGDKEVVDEVESEDQMTYNVAEDNPPDSGAADTDAEIADTNQANASAASYDEAEAEEESASDEAVEEADESMDDEEELNEWANEAGKDGTDAAFEADINFMTKVISGGLNKQKATGQTTIPVVSTQLNRMHSHDTTDVNESVADWKKLAGIK